MQGGWGRDGLQVEGGGVPLGAAGIDVCPVCGPSMWNLSAGKLSHICVTAPYVALPLRLSRTGLWRACRLWLPGAWPSHQHWWVWGGGMNHPPSNTILLYFLPPEFDRAPLVFILLPYRLIPSTPSSPSILRRRPIWDASRPTHPPIPSSSSNLPIHILPIGLSHPIIFPPLRPGPPLSSARSPPRSPASWKQRSGTSRNDPEPARVTLLPHLPRHQTPPLPLRCCWRSSSRPSSWRQWSTVMAAGMI